MLKLFICKAKRCISIALATKAEFDAALSDFNARLTTFEAGINSKIDSQVSSYLDRNGIWNGAEQTIIPALRNGWNCEMQLTEEDEAFPENTNYFLTQWNYSGDYWDAGLLRYNSSETPIPNARRLVQDNIAAQKDVLIENVTKSGLLFMNYRVRLIIKSRSDNVDWESWQDGIHNPTGNSSQKATRTGGWYSDWYKNYYHQWSDTDLSKQCNNINDIAMDPVYVYFRGLYFLTTSIATWGNWSIRPYWCFYTQTESGSSVEKMRTAGDNYLFANSQQHSAGSNNYTWRPLAFGDYTYESTAQFFVSKGDKILVGSGATVAGWQLADFYSHVRTAGIALVVQALPPSVY